MDSPRAALARRILKILAEGSQVPVRDALQLRSWASAPEDAMLPLAEIAIEILNREQEESK